MLKIRMPHRLHVLVLCVALAAMLCLVDGCSSKPKSTPSDKKALSGTDEQIFLGDTIEKNYDPNVIMKRGEAFFEKEEFPEAIVEYQHFLDLHRTHILAPYAQFRLGESHLRIARSIDRDPDPIHKAIAAFERLQKEFPNSRYEAQAIQRIGDCHDWLAQTHLFVGQFYYRRDSFLAAAHRFDQIMKEYPDKSVAPEALYYLALSYKEMGANDWASEKLIMLAEKYPNSEAAQDGKKLLARLRTTPPSTVVAKSQDSSPPPSAPVTAHSQESAPPPAPAEPEPKLFADNRPQAPIPIPSGHASALSGTNGTSLSSSHASALSGTNGASSLTQRFVSCRLGAWC